MKAADAATTRREYYPLRTIDIAAIVGFWAFLSFVSALGRELDPRIPDVARNVVSAVVADTYVEYAVWAVITVPIWWLATRYSVERGRRAERVAAFAVLGVLVAIAMDVFLRQVRNGFLPPAPFARMRMRRIPPPMLGGLGFLDDLMVYFAVLGSGIARDYFLRYRTRLRETIQLQSQLTQARLDALRTQLNPHFLFNTLNSVSALLERDPRGARRMIARLSELLRYTLEESTEQEVPLHRELDVLEEYVDLMQIRFQDRLEVRMDVSDDARVAYVPNLLLQPIVENALKHGVSQQTGVGRITIRAVRRGEDLVLTVTDNGPGPTGGSDGVGLRNTNARLRQLYGEQYGVTLTRVDNAESSAAMRQGDAGETADRVGAEARIVLPYHRERIAAPAGGEGGAAEP